MRCLLHLRYVTAPIAAALLPSRSVLLAEAAEEPAGETACLTALPELSTAATADEFDAHFLRHGAALFRFEPELADREQLVFRVFDSLAASQGVVRLRDGLTPRNATDTVALTGNPENRTRAGSPQRLHFAAHQTLAPADATVQGPHQEGASSTRGQRRIIAFSCEEPATTRGGTALFDMQRAWELLPGELRGRLARASFTFKQASGRRLTVPAVVLHDVTGAPCLQFYGFGRVRHVWVDVYRKLTGRYDARPDPYMYSMDPDEPVMLTTAGGASRPFVGHEIYQLMLAIGKSMIEHTWSKGDALLVDNIRWAHARLDGSGAGRKILFWFYGWRNGTFDLHSLKRPSA